MPIRRKSAALTTTSKVPAEGAPPTNQEIRIRPLNLVRTTITVRGTSELIMHAWSQKAISMMEAKQQKKVSVKQAKDPNEEFNNARYHMDEMRDGIPAIAFKCCAVEAGVALGIFKTLLRKSFFVCPDGEELLPILNEHEQPCVPYMRTDMVRVGQGVADVRYRPGYRNWRCKIPVEFNADLISAEELFNLFDAAGHSIGVGEWRVECDGNYGRFRVLTEDAGK